MITTFQSPTALNLLASLDEFTVYTNHSDGEFSHLACTTIQYGYKPSTNTTRLTVAPQATDVVTPEKTPEQLQQEAENSEWLRIEPEFSWWYPWFRLHYKLNVNLPQGNPNIDYGWSPLPFGESYSANNHALANILNDGSSSIQQDVIVSYYIGVLLQFGIGIFLGRTGIYAAIAIGVYAAYSLASAWFTYTSSGAKPEAWLNAFIASAISGTCGLAFGGIQSVISLLTSTSRLVMGKIQSVLHSLWAQGLNFFNIVGAAFALIDFAFMVFYLSMYLASIKVI